MGSFTKEVIGPAGYSHFFENYLWKRLPLLTLPALSVSQFFKKKNLWTFLIFSCFCGSSFWGMLPPEHAPSFWSVTAVKMLTSISIRWSVRPSLGLSRSWKIYSIRHVARFSKGSFTRTSRPKLKNASDCRNQFNLLPIFPLLSTLSRPSAHFETLVWMVSPYSFSFSLVFLESWRCFRC